MLRASLVIDYQNVHLTARDVFAPGTEAHESLIHPVRFAETVVRVRNSRQRDGYPDAELKRVSVFRGLPHVDHNPEQHRRCLMQAAAWREAGAEVELRDLTYTHEYGADGRAIRDIHGRKVAIGPGREKGIDVMIALACVREARRSDVDIVILASRDTDLVPVLDEIVDLRSAEPLQVARIETVTWFDSKCSRNFGSLRATSPRRIWNTNLGLSEFEASIDRDNYL